MDKAVRGIKVSLAVVLSITFILTSLLAMIVYNLERSMSDADLYLGVLEDLRLYDRLPIIATEALVETSQSKYGFIAILKDLPQDERDTVLHRIFPDYLLKSITDDTIVQIFGYLNGGNKDINLSLTELKNYLLSPSGVDAIYQYISAQPDCTLEQLTSMVTGGSGFILCKPPEQFLGFELRPIYEAQIRATVRLMPEEISLVKPGQETNKIIRVLNRLRVVSRLIPIIPLLALFIVTVLIVRSFNDWLIWWGFPLVLTSIPGIFISLGSGPIIDYYFQNHIAPEMLKDLPISLTRVIQEMAGAITTQALEPMLIQAILLGCAGGVMLVIRLTIYFIKREKSLTAEY